MDYMGMTLIMLVAILICVPSGEASFFYEHFIKEAGILGPLVCMAGFIAICACFCREWRRRQATLAAIQSPPVTLQDSLSGPMSPHAYEPVIAGVPATATSPLRPPPPGFVYPYSCVPPDPPPPYEYKAT